MFIFSLLSSFLFRNKNEFSIRCTSVSSFRPNTIWRHAANYHFPGQSYQLGYSQHKKSELDIALFPTSWDLVFLIINMVSKVGGIRPPHFRPISIMFQAGWCGDGINHRFNERYDSFYRWQVSPFALFISWLFGRNKNLGSSHPVLLNITRELVENLGRALSLGADWTIEMVTDTRKPSVTTTIRSWTSSLWSSSGSWGGGLHLTGALGYFGGSYRPDQYKSIMFSAFRSRCGCPKISWYHSLLPSYSYQPTRNIFQKSGCRIWICFISFMRQRSHRTFKSFARKKSATVLQLQEIAREILYARNTGKVCRLYLRRYEHKELLSCFFCKQSSHTSCNSLQLAYSQNECIFEDFWISSVSHRKSYDDLHKSVETVYTYTIVSYFSRTNTRTTVMLFSHITSSIAKPSGCTKIAAIHRPSSLYCTRSQRPGLYRWSSLSRWAEDLFEEWFDSPLQVDGYGTEPFSDGWVQRPVLYYAQAVIVSGSSQDWSFWWTLHGRLEDTHWANRKSAKGWWYKSGCFARWFSGRICICIRRDLESTTATKKGKAPYH